MLANILTGLGVDEFLTRNDVVAGTTSHFLPDALGSAVALADSAGAVQTEYTYEPFGRTTATGASNTNPFQYTGRENDGTGLYYYRARYYHPQFQRFISEDPIGFYGGDFNLYAYVKNKPVVLRDPFGLAAKCAERAWQNFWVCISAITIGADLALAPALAGCLFTGPAAIHCALNVTAIIELPAVFGYVGCFLDLLKKLEKCRNEECPQ